ncbi:AN1-type zinc finger protein 5-like [Grus japonensis]|uniref:AN1-type zinc finger protein 5-like n=1 Tax=Grus japonensis TaxID=30415 RepID=A0ABC9WZQ8_GRUJA
MVRQAVPLQPMEDDGGAEIHLQPVEDPTVEQVEAPERVCDAVGSSCWSKLLAGPVDPWREEPTPEQNHIPWLPIKFLNRPESVLLKSNVMILLFALLPSIKMLKSIISWLLWSRLPQTTTSLTSFTLFASVRFSIDSPLINSDYPLINSDEALGNLV